MALNDIITTLNSDAAAEIAAIALARDTEIADIKATYIAYTEKRTREAVSDSQRRAEKVTERILAKARHQVTFITIGAIQSEIEAVFVEAQALLTNLSAEDYRIFLDRRFGELPHDKAGATYTIAVERAEETQRFLISNGVDATVIKTGTGLIGGFIMSTATREYNHSFTGALDYLRTTQTVHISQQLAA